MGDTPVDTHVAGHAPGGGAPWSRRQFLGAAGVGAAGLVVPTAVWLPERSASSSPNAFTGTSPLRLAMHVHGSWSEQTGSWEAQFTQAVATGTDVLFMTDHDYRATASGYFPSLNGVTWVRTTTGGLAQQTSTASGGSLHLLAESSSATTSASVTMSVRPKPDAVNRLRTSVAGQTLVQTATSARLTQGARYEVVVDMSYHPAASGRPAGTYELVYRFGGGTGQRFTENGGLTGVVALPTPAAGSVRRLSLETDIAALWPTMLPIDNAMFGLSFRVTSPQRGAVADVTIAGLKFERTQNSAASVTANQGRVISTYQSRFPSLTVRASSEIGRSMLHMNPFGIPQYWPNYAALPSDENTRFRQIVSTVHGQNGLVSWNHPFGYDMGPLLSPTDRVAKRRSIFQSMLALQVLGVDVLEVGYKIRGYVDAATHIALWDTFSRNGTFLTGNGATDDHSGQPWTNLTNGFTTGAWAASRSDADVVAALAAGRAYVADMKRWPGGEADLLVDGTVPMGAASVSSKVTRSLSIWAKSLPANCTVQVISGPVDYKAAVDPGTVVVRTLSPSAFTGGSRHSASTCRRPGSTGPRSLPRTGRSSGAATPCGCSAKPLRPASRRRAV